LSSLSSSPPIAEGARHPATLSTSVEPVACFDSFAADEGNDDPSSLPWALSAPSSLVASSADCCIAWTHRQRMSGRGPPSPRRCHTRRPGRGGEGHKTQRLWLPGSCSRSVGYLRTVIPAAAVAGRGGSDGRGSSSGDSDLFCCGCGRMFCVFGLVAVRCLCW
jgi:hypothetical protein